MKRSAGDRFGSGSKRTRMDSYEEALANGKYELRLVVTSRGAGGIIGRGGENIKRLRSEFDANLTVPDSQTPERVLTLTATTENIANCLREIIPRLDENREDDHDRRMKKADRSDSEMKVLVHESHAGAVIGRGGSRIKELREKTGAQLKVFSRCAPQSTERIVLLNGEVEKIIDCINIIIDVLKEIPIKGPVRPYDPMYYDPDIISDYGGYVPDRNFISRVGRGRDFGFSSGIIPSRYPGRDDRYGGMRDMMGRYSPIPAMQTTQVETTDVTIPDELGGAIIGKGGSRINRVREESGAQIEVEPHRDNGGDRIITISGTREQIQAAQYLLQQCVRTSEAGRRYLSEH
ncbi:KH domain family protein [Brugia pahangi]|uniref:K Homology domain-containing protein n=2 Tax=Brugia malayi TaxID=6279 RepID=A0A7I4KQM7_BRUMA